MPTFNNMDKRGKHFQYHNFQKQDYFNTDFSHSNMDFTNFRGAHFKSCNFTACSFKWSSFVGTNLKGSMFANAVFESAVFEGAKLDGADFKLAQFQNVIFVETQIEKAINLDETHPGIRVFEKMPQIQLSDELVSVVQGLLLNQWIKRSRVLDTKDGKINTISMMLLIERYGEAVIIQALRKIEPLLDRDFYTLSYLMKAIDKVLAQGE